MSAEWLPSDGTTFEGPRVPEGSSSTRESSGYKSYQKGIQKRPMPKNDKIGTEEENFSLHYV